MLDTAQRIMETPPSDTERAIAAPSRAPAVRDNPILERLASMRRHLAMLRRRACQTADVRPQANLKRAIAECEIRKLEQRIALALPGAADDRDRVRLGSIVQVVDDDGDMRSYRVVGNHEADAQRGWVGWNTPAGQALCGARIGEVACWTDAGRELAVFVLAIRFDDSVPLPRAVPNDEGDTVIVLSALAACPS
jgi:transcription elongation GreA/GreB family factor